MKIPKRKSKELQSAPKKKRKKSQRTINKELREREEKKIKRKKEQQKALAAQIDATRYFNPYKLSEHLTRTEEGIVIVDRKQILNWEKDYQRFYTILKKDYYWDYSYPDTTTIYLYVDEGVVVGGVYEMEYGVRGGRVIAVARSNAKSVNYSTYVYEDKKYEKLVNNILNA